MTATARPTTRAGSDTDGEEELPAVYATLVCAESVELVLLQPARRGQPALYCLGHGESEGLARAAAAKLSQPVLTLVADTAAS